MLWIVLLSLILTAFVFALERGIDIPSFPEILLPIGVVLSVALLIFSLARRLTRMDSASPWKW